MKINEGKKIDTTISFKTMNVLRILTEKRRETESSIAVW